MGKLTVFNFLTLNGFYKGPGEDISWHKHGHEENQVAREGLGSGHTLLFGRKTYDMMAAYWPSSMAQQNDPEIAAGMNNASKLVMSKSMKTASWQNTEVISSIDDIRKRKEKAAGITILGSGSIVTLCTAERLIDEYMLLVDPVAIRQGTPFLDGIDRQVDLVLIGTKTLKSGSVLLTYITNPEGVITNPEGVKDQV